MLTLKALKQGQFAPTSKYYSSDFKLFFFFCCKYTYWMNSYIAMLLSINENFFQNNINT